MVGADSFEAMADVAVAFALSYEDELPPTLSKPTRDFVFGLYSQASKLRGEFGDCPEKVNAKIATNRKE